MLSNKISKFNIEFVNRLLDMGTVPHSCDTWSSRYYVFAEIINYTELYLYHGRLLGKETDAEK